MWMSPTHCAYDGCRKDLQYYQKSLKEFNDQTFCSQRCLNDQYESMSEKKAIHAVHQMFGPDHPVTYAIKMMRNELGTKRFLLDLEGKRKRGKEWEDKNFKRLCHMTEKCL